MHVHLNLDFFGLKAKKFKETFFFDLLYFSNWDEYRHLMHILLPFSPAPKSCGKSSSWYGTIWILKNIIFPPFKISIKVCMSTLKNLIVWIFYMSHKSYKPYLRFSPASHRYAITVINGNHHMELSCEDNINHVYSWWSYPTML